MLAWSMNLGFAGGEAAALGPAASLWHELRRRRILASRRYLPEGRLEPDTRGAGTQETDQCYGTDLCLSEGSS